MTWGRKAQCLKFEKSLKKPFSNTLQFELKVKICEGTFFTGELETSSMKRNDSTCSHVNWFHFMFVLTCSTSWMGSVHFSLIQALGELMPFCFSKFQVPLKCKKSKLFPESLNCRFYRWPLKSSTDVPCSMMLECCVNLDAQFLGSPWFLTFLFLSPQTSRRRVACGRQFLFI